MVIGGDLEPVGLADSGDLGVGLPHVHSEGKEPGRAAQWRSEIAVLEALQVVLADHQALAVVGLRLRQDAVKQHFANDGSARIRPGNLQVHWPEGNVLIPYRRFDPDSGEPDYNAVVEAIPLNGRETGSETASAGEG